MAAPELWERVQSIFRETVQLAPEERLAFLDSARGGDETLRLEVESLLKHDLAASEDFLKPPSPPTFQNDPPPLDRRVGAVIGQYRIQSVIAAGGMGTVYLAQQEHPHRSIALKVMNAGLTSRSARGRFEYESEILARLQHPNIAQIFEAGVHTEDGHTGTETSYFAMEYVPKATTITDYANIHRLDTRQRLRLFTQVCDAVQHGHQNGIIHRDLKPANILVDSEGRVKIIDFGVARSTNSDLAVTTVHTDVGQLIGTVQYMSPEQCEADPTGIDTRSDIYAMGVILYELICEKMPYKVSRTSILDSIRVIREEFPLRPRVVRRSLSPSLEAILLKTLEKNRETRYQSATELAQDIRNYLTGEPVNARTPTIWGRVARCIVRRPKTATILLCLLIAVTSFISTELSVYWYNQRPSAIEVDRDKKVAVLYARSGRPLRTWEHAHCGMLVDKPGQLGSGQFVIIGYYCSAPAPFRGQLCAYDPAQGFDKPIWHVGVSKDEVPSALLEQHPEVQDFGVSNGAILDVFPETPGDELVVWFAHGIFSQYCLRIYDMQGHLLYELWQDGGIIEAQWMKSEGLLFLLGGDEYLKQSDPRFNRIDYPFALAVFAVRPHLGERRRKFLSPTDAGDDSYLAWFDILMPAATDTCWMRDPTFNTKLPISSKDSVPTLLVYQERNSDLFASIRIFIDRHGNEVPNTRIVSDAYVFDQSPSGNHVFPDLSSVRLVPYNEIIATNPASTTQPADAIQ